MDDSVVPVPVPTQWDGTILGLLAIVLMVLLGVVVLYLRYQLMVAGPAKDRHHAEEMKECRDREDRIRADFLAALQTIKDNNDAAMQAVLANYEAERKAHREELAQLRHELTTHRHEILEVVKDARPPTKRS